MKTYQDLEKATDLDKFVSDVIVEHMGTTAYREACIAERYDRGDTDILNYQKFLYNSMGQAYEDKYAANNQLPTNIFGKLVTQENEYSLGNGVNFTDQSIDEKLGAKFDSVIEEVGRNGLLGGKSFMYVGQDNDVAFKLTEFAPLYDKETGSLMAGVRFYKPIGDDNTVAWLYKADGYIKFNQSENEGFKQDGEKQPYAVKVTKTKADGIIDTKEINIGVLPIVQFNANDYCISEVHKVKAKIDAYDFTLSELQNDLDENAFIYWVIKNNGGMEDADLARFKQALKTSKVASIDSQEGGDVEHFTKEIPYEARTTMLEILKRDIYESMSCVDMNKLSSSAVNEMQINAMYSAMDNKASEFEKNIRKFVQDVLKLKGIVVDGYDITFIRNKLQNEQEEANVTSAKVNYIMQVANEIDKKTLLEALKKAIPELKDIEVDTVLSNKDVEIDFTIPQGQQEDTQLGSIEQ